MPRKITASQSDICHMARPLGSSDGPCRPFYPMGLHRSHIDLSQFPATSSRSNDFASRSRTQESGRLRRSQPVFMDYARIPMRTLALSILAMSIALADGQARAQTYGPGLYGPWAYESAPNSYCLQGRDWGYPGNCQFSSYAQCMATASGTFSYCGSIPTTRTPASGAATIDPDTDLPASDLLRSKNRSRVSTPWVVTAR